jgi:uncharacterized protein (TIGR03435 family)
MIWPDLHTWDALRVFAELFWKSGALLGTALGANSFSHGAPVARLVGKAQPLSSLVHMLSSSTHAYVIDKTGLQGKYDFRLEYAFDSAPTTAASRDDSISAPSPAPSIFTAIKSLGLTLRPARASLDVLVIDHIDRVLRPN